MISSKNVDYSNPHYYSMSYAKFDIAPPNYSKPKNEIDQWDSFRTVSRMCDDDSKGQGISRMTRDNMTEQDVLRSGFLLHSNDNPTKNHNRGQGMDIGHVSFNYNTPLWIAFSSESNIAHLQREIKYSVNRQSKGKLYLEVDQDQKDLYTKMDEVYQQYGKFLVTNIKQQVGELNSTLLQLIVPGIIEGSFFESYYQSTIDQPINPMALPINTSSRGRQNKASVTTVWF